MTISKQVIGTKPVAKLEGWNVVGSQATGTVSDHQRRPDLNGHWATTSTILGLDREKRMIETRNTCYELGTFAALKQSELDAATQESNAFDYIEGIIEREPSGYSPNTLYVVGTNDKAQLTIQSTRTSFEAAKDYHIMSAALELSQAVELRGVSFGEHTIGSLIVRPVTSKDPESKLDDNESSATALWAEIHRLRARLQGPAGYATWQDAATDERVKRVAAETKLKGVVEMALCTVPHLILRADVLYRFTTREGCEKCAQAASHYADESTDGPNG